MGAIGIEAAFPSRLETRDALEALGPALSTTGTRPLGSYRASVPILIAGEPVTIPNRVSYEPPDMATYRALPAQQQLIIAAILTRHHDGHVRQRWLEEILPVPELFIAPFVLQLLGEYVLEIVRDVADGLSDLSIDGSAVQAAYRSFAASNSPFLALVRQRATSYWSCYHRSEYVLKEDYPAFSVLDAIERGTRTEHPAADHRGLRAADRVSSEQAVTTCSLQSGPAGPAGPTVDGRGARHE